MQAAMQHPSQRMSGTLRLVPGGADSGAADHRGDDDLMAEVQVDRTLPLLNW